jgi:dTDP-4-amino-4,6-dideoxygalactose transaminase
MAEGIYQITEDFEKAIQRYTGAPYAIAVDNQSNAMLLCLLHEGVEGKEISIPCRTYPSVPCMIVFAGGKVKFEPVEGLTLKGAYQLKETRIWDSALRFTCDMYIPNSLMCLSFTGPFKNLKLGKGGAILTDDYQAMLWFKRARFNGRRECSYHTDNFDMLGFNFYMLPEIATRGLMLMGQFYDRLSGKAIHNEDIELPYPDLSQFPIYTKGEICRNLSF